MKNSILKLTFYNNDKICSIIYADYACKKVKVENFEAPAIKLAFGINTSPTWEDYQAFLEERCIPRERAGLREYLEAIGLYEYEPIEIIKKTKGRMAEDNQWISLEEM